MRFVEPEYRGDDLSYREIEQRKLKSYREGIEIARGFLHKSSGGRNFLYSLAAAISVAFYYAVYPHIDHWIGAKTTVFVGLVATVSFGVFAFSFYRIQRNYDQRKKLARRYYDLFDYLEHLTASQSLPSDILGSAMDILVQTLRQPLDYALENPRQTTRFNSPIELRKYLLGVLDYAAMLLEPDPTQRKIRCGLIIENPWDSSTFIPMVVYDPRNDTYIASRYLTRDKDLPGAHLRYFQDVEVQPVFRERCAYHIPDTLNFYEEHRGELNPPFRFHSDDQKDYLKCILSVVIYIRREGKLSTVGLLAFDAPVQNYIKMDRYEQALPALKLAYRILGIRLASIFGDKAFVDELWGGRHTPGNSGGELDLDGSSVLVQDSNGVREESARRAANE